MSRLPSRHCTSFDFFVKSMPPSLSELKVTPSFCFPIKIRDDRTASTVYNVKSTRFCQFFWPSQKIRTLRIQIQKGVKVLLWNQMKYSKQELAILNWFQFLILRCTHNDCLKDVCKLLFDWVARSSLLCLWAKILEFLAC